MTTYLINLKAFSPCLCIMWCDAMLFLYVARLWCLRYVLRFSQSRTYFYRLDVKQSLCFWTRFSFLQKMKDEREREKLSSKNRLERTGFLLRLTNRFVVDLHAVRCVLLFVLLRLESFWLYIDELILFCRTHIHILFRATIDDVDDVDDGKSKSIKIENCYVL